MTKLPAGPARLPFAGNLLQFGKDPLQFVTECVEKYDNVIRLKVEQNRDTFLLTDPKDIDFVLKNTNKLFTKGYYRDPILHLVLGNGLVTSEGDFWKKQRRLTQPLFRMDEIKTYTETMSDHAQQMVHAWENGEIDIHAELMAVTMRIVAKTLFDYDTNDHDDSNEISESMETVQNEYNKQMTSVTKMVLGLLKLSHVKTAGDKRLQEAVNRLDQTIYEMIEHRRQTNLDGRHDLLSILMNVEENGDRMTNEQLRDEMMTFFLAGHETTANTLTWAFYLLGQHPDILEQLRKEVKEKVGDAPLSMENISELSYMDNVLKEVMRLYPAVWWISRGPMQDVELNGYHIPKGTDLALSQWAMHRHPDYFDNPHSFEPDRWEGDFEKSLPNTVYFPFGGGPRICIGNHFALTEAKIILGTIVQQFDVSLSSKEEVQIEPAITLRPKNGVKVKITRLS
ncbi:cytochrome P450 [Alkalihalobacterium bogoriense]|uniref:cytochrome P450 n=1 Tax=Alkalihalobacterium bogoriense TaxID=246272 RepID=UPI00047DEA5A|nr:cytochrome P450 [Alkalihalobacterium bogoriense]